MWVSEGGDLVEEIGERFGGVGQAVFAAPSDPSGLGEFCISGQGVGEGLDVDDPVSGYGSDGGAEYGLVVRAGGQVGDVDEVAPAGVSGASLDGGDDLFGEDQFDAVTGDRDWGPAEESWHVDGVGWRGERVADVDVDVEPDAGGGEAAGDLGSGAWVHLVVSGRFDGCGGQVKGQTVVTVDGENVVDDGSEVFGVAVDVGGGEVEITSGPATVERGEKDTAFEDQVVVVG